MNDSRPRNRIDRVTTGGGDGGQTSLADPHRYPKYHPRIELVGALDEANSQLGLLAARTAAGEHLGIIQSRLFDAGAAVATGGSAIDWAALAADLETWTATLNKELAPLREFILPGGGEAAATAHVARTVVRRAERAWWQAAQDSEQLRAIAIGVYLNRLSDYLFVLARTLADSERLWQPLTPQPPSPPE